MLGDTLGTERRLWFQNESVSGTEKLSLDSIQFDGMTYIGSATRWTYLGANGARA